MNTQKEVNLTERIYLYLKVSVKYWQEECIPI